MTATPDFASFGLRTDLVTACQARGFRTPMPIQGLAIPALMAGRDVLIQAKTGSGKTLAYGLPILNHDPVQAVSPEALIVTPTRELARQVASELEKTGAALQRTVVLADGGGRTERQISLLAKGANVVVGTPGRILDLVRRGGLRLTNCRFLVLDEADELIQRGFSDDLDAIAAILPDKRQTILCSATIPVEVETLAKRYMRHAERISQSAGKELPQEIEHRVIYTSIEDRLADLIAWLKLEQPYQTLIFTGSRAEADELTPSLMQAGLDAETFHGDLSAVKRRQLIDRFRSGDLPILVATDIAARGLDLPGVTHVVNQTLPKGIGAYVHRTGRTGRAGKAGMAVSLVIPQELDRLERLKPVFGFAAITVRGAKAGEVRPLQSNKLKQTRADRRGLTKRWAAEAEAKAAKEAARMAAKAAEKAAEREQRAAAGDAPKAGPKGAGPRQTGKPGTTSAGKTTDRQQGSSRFSRTAQAGSGSPKPAKPGQSKGPAGAKGGKPGLSKGPGGAKGGKPGPKSASQTNRRRER